MTESSKIQDPSARFVDAQQDDLVDYVFRLTGDRGRAAVMARESCRLMTDELESQTSESTIRARLFQLAYELNEEAMRPIARGFFESWYRYHHKDPKTVALSYRWEIRLLDLGHHAAQLLLLRYRYRFSQATCAWILYRDEDDIEAELRILENLVSEENGLKMDDLTQLPRYGFLDMPEQQTTALSHIMQQLTPRSRWWAQLAVVLAFVMLAVFFWAVYEFAGFSQLWRVMRSWLFA